MVYYAVNPNTISRAYISFSKKMTTKEKLRTFCVQFLPHNPPHLKLHSPLCWNVNSLQCFRILGSSRRYFPDFKHTEIAEFHPVALGEFKDDLIKKALDYGLNPRLRSIRCFCYSTDKVFLCGCCHQLILRPDYIRLPKQYTREIVLG